MKPKFKIGDKVQFINYQEDVYTITGIGPDFGEYILNDGRIFSGKNLVLYESKEQLAVNKFKEEFINKLEKTLINCKNEKITGNRFDENMKQIPITIDYKQGIIDELLIIIQYLKLLE